MNSPLGRHGAALILILSAALSGGCSHMGPISDFSQRMVDYFHGNTPLIGAQKMEDTYFPDERRDGIIRLSDRSYGRKPPYTTRYQQIAQYDTDWLVRATAIRALNRSRDASATPIFIKALSDENDVVRVEAAKALNNVPDPNAAPELLRLVSDPNQNKDVRIWSAEALRHYRTLEVARTLAAQLEGREFAVAWQSHRSLMQLTGKDMHFSEAAWLQYLTGTQSPFG